MNKVFTKAAVLIFTVFLAASTAQVDTLTILHLNDTHSTLAPVGPRDASLAGTRGGIARAAAVIGNSRMSDPNVIVLHAGDYSIGDLFYNAFFGVPELQLLKSLGLDAMTVGNHEWDLTPSTLLGALQTAFPNLADGFPLLSANTDLSDPSLAGLKNYILPYTVRQVGNIKVGIFGMTTPETNLLSNPSPAVISEDIINISANTVASLTAQNCEVIILLSHLGLDLDKLVASYIPGINVIVGGHDHYKLASPVVVQNPSGLNTLILQAGSNYLYIGKLKLIINSGTINSAGYNLIPLDKSVPEVPEISAVVNSLISNIETTYGIPFYTQQAGFAEFYFEESAENLLEYGSHDTPIGNLVTDAFRAKTGTDIAIQAGGFTAFPLFKGPFTPSDLYRVNGYGFNTVNTLGFQLAKFEITGADIIAGLEFGLSAIEANDEFLMQVSGMDYTYDGNLPPFSRITSVNVNGSPIDPNAVYTVTANEGSLLFLNYLGINISNPEVLAGVTEFQALSEYVQNTGADIYPRYLGRISNVNSNAGRELITGCGNFEVPAGSFITNPGCREQMHFVFEINLLKKRINSSACFFIPKEKFIFNATDIEWTAVNEDTVQFRGSGKINGKKGYGFLVTASESKKNKDKIRLIIWDKSNGDALVFDNFGMKAVRGNISIHQLKSGRETAQNDNEHNSKCEQFQNYPNPFNPVTTFEINIPGNENVILKIFNVLGQEVATVVNSQLPAGIHKYSWNASGLASGIYFSRLEAGNYVSIKKLILMK